MRLLVCGSRDWDSFPDTAEAIEAVAREIMALAPSVVIHGAAPGADTVAGGFAEARGIVVLPFPADWAAHGKSAGPKRNARMLDEGKPDRGLAFGPLWKPHPSARAISAAVGADVRSWKRTGTGDMVSRMLRAGLPVRWVSAPGAEAIDLVEMPPVPAG